MATNKNSSQKAAARGMPQTLSTTLDDILSGEHDRSTGRDRVRPGFADRDGGKLRQACRVHAFEYARRIVLSAMAGPLDGEGLFFDVIGLQQHLAEGVRLSYAKTPADTRSVRLFGYNGPMENVVSRFCVEVQGLCSAADIPNPPTTDGLHQWATVTQRNLRSQFAGWGLETIRLELDAVADRLAVVEPA
jgi:hypothetical protein